MNDPPREETEPRRLQTKVDELLRKPSDESPSLAEAQRLVAELAIRLAALEKENQELHVRVPDQLSEAPGI